jgi:hypothetical protein
LPSSASVCHQPESQRSIAATKIQETLDHEWHESKPNHTNKCINKVLKMLQKKGKITQDMIALLDKWRHSGFNVYCGPRIQPGDEESMENLARYIARGASACAARPRLILPGTDDIFPGGFKGCLSVEGRQRGKNL